MGIISKVKFGFFSFVVLGVVIWVVPPLLRDTKQRDRSPEEYTFEVVFKPEKPLFPVLASIFVDGVHLVTEEAPVSPWKKNYRGERGDVMKLTSSQSRNGELTCTIFRASDLAIFSDKITKFNQMCEVETR